MMTRKSDILADDERLVLTIFDLIPLPHKRELLTATKLSEDNSSVCIGTEWRNSKWIYTILDNIKDGVNLVGDDLHLKYTNPAFDKMFGYERGELRGKHVSILNHDKFNTFGIVQHIHRQLELHGSWRGTLENSTKSGELIRTIAKIAQIAINGHTYWLTIRRPR